MTRRYIVLSLDADVPSGLLVTAMARELMHVQPQIPHFTGSSLQAVDELRIPAGDFIQIFTCGSDDASADLTYLTDFQEQHPNVTPLRRSQS